VYKSAEGMRQSCECTYKQKEGGGDDAQCGHSLLCFQGSFGANLRSLHRSGLLDKELDSAIGVRFPRFRTGEKGYIYLYMYVTNRYTKVFMCFRADDARRDEYPS
jgi:hypothetical protein